MATFVTSDLSDMLRNSTHVDESYRLYLTWGDNVRSKWVQLIK